MSRIGLRSFNLKTLIKIHDSKEDVVRVKGSIFEVDENRFNEMLGKLGKDFETYFSLLSIKLKQIRS